MPLQRLPARRIFNIPRNGTKFATNVSIHAAFRWLHFICPAEHSSTRFLFRRIANSFAQVIHSRVSGFGLFCPQRDTFSGGLNNIWQIKLVPSAIVPRDHRFLDKLRRLHSILPGFAPFRIHFVTQKPPSRTLKFRRTMSLTCQNRAKTPRESCGESF